MHLMDALPVTENDDDLEEKMALISDFPITIDKREVWKLMEEYEERNTKLVTNVNTGEYDLVMGDKDDSKVTLGLSKKIARVIETISVLRERKIECDKKNEFYSAPLRAAQKQ